MLFFYGDKEAFAIYDDKKPSEVEISNDEKYLL